MHDFSVRIMRQRDLHGVVTSINLTNVVAKSIYSSNSINAHSILGQTEFVVIALVVRRRPRLVHVRRLDNAWVAQLLGIQYCIIMGILVSMVLMVAQDFDLLVIVTIYYHMLIKRPFVILRFNLVINQISIFVQVVFLVLLWSHINGFEGSLMTITIFILIL